MGTGDMHQAKRRRIEVLISSRPTPYMRGCGPSLAPISIALASEPNAHIIDKTVLPTYTINGDLKLQLHYIIGWGDLPAASVAIPAAEVRDYIAPKTLEDFEYNLSLERDKEEEGKKIAIGNSARNPVKTLAKIVRKTKRGRPGKKGVMMYETAEPINEDLSSLLPSTTIVGPSLSTPQKSISKSVGLLTDDENDDQVDIMDSDSAAIFRQLSRETPGYIAVGNNPDPNILDGYYQKSNTPVSRNGTLSENRIGRLLFKSSPSSVDELASQVEQESVYEVKKIEADDVIGDGDQKERWYYVRWQGDWPSDQNPTWEPEHNLPSSLVKKYLKKKAAKPREKTLSNDKGAVQRSLRMPSPKKKYSSVAEAFAGDPEGEEGVLGYSRVSPGKDKMAKSNLL
ncbi:hypothetical protein BX600DRAFT_108671 [Xylariales sp. PMI_506]|nr:hypothetical protein BX600DRAFT_108671 [Xylariales sp. PMI_506]